MRQTRQILLVLGFMLYPCAIRGQYADGLEPDRVSGSSLHSDRQQTPDLHTHKWAGFGAGATVTAIVFSLDGVVGDSCIGSGSYLGVCRVGFIAMVAGGGGLGALAGQLVKTEHPAGRTTRMLLGATLGTLGAFVVSVVACEQESSTNPSSLCGYDGMTSTSAVVGGAAVGGVLGALIGGGPRGLQVRQFGLVPDQDGSVGLGASFTMPTR